MGRALRALLCSAAPRGPIRSFNMYSSIFYSVPDSGDAGHEDMVPALMRFMVEKERQRLSLVNGWAWKFSLNK